MSDESDAYRPAEGDVVSLPSWLPDRPYRVSGVHRSVDDGAWVWLTGRLIESTGYERPEAYHVPAASLRRVPCPDATSTGSVTGAADIDDSVARALALAERLLGTIEGAVAADDLDAVRLLLPIIRSMLAGERTRWEQSACVLRSGRSVSAGAGDRTNRIRLPER